MFLSGRKIIELFTSCSHRLVCTRCRYFFVFCEWSQKLKVLSSCVVVKLRVFCTTCCHRFVCTRCAEICLFAVYLSFCECCTQKLKGLFLCVVVKLRVLFMSCCHMLLLVCVPKNYLFANLLSFYWFSQKSKVLFLCGVVRLKVLVTVVIRLFAYDFSNLLSFCESSQN